MSTSPLNRLAYAFSFAALLVGCTFDQSGRPDNHVNIAANSRPYFELSESPATGRHSFRFADEERGTLLEAKGYKTRQGALSGVISVLDNGGLSQRYRVAAVDGGGHVLELVAQNGNVVAESSVYPDAKAAEKGVDAMTRAIAEYLEAKHQRKGARFDVYADEEGRFYFDILAEDGSLLLASQRYESEASALNGAFSSRENGMRPERYRVVETAEGGTYLELRARNGRALARSAIFETRTEAEVTRSEAVALIPELPIL